MGDVFVGFLVFSGKFFKLYNLSVYIKRLREKLAAAGDEERITTVRGLGYRLEVKG